MHFLYFTVEAKAELFRSFLLSDEDRIVKSLDVDDISRLLSTGRCIAIYYRALVGYLWDIVSESKYRDDGSVIGGGIYF